MHVNERKRCLERKKKMFNGRIVYKQSRGDWPAKRNKDRPLYTRRFRFFWQLETGARVLHPQHRGFINSDLVVHLDRLLSGGYPRLTIPRKKAPSPILHLIACIGIPAIQKMCQTRFPYPFAFLLFSPRHRYIFPTWRFSFRTTRLSRYSLINIIARQSLLLFLRSIVAFNGKCVARRSFSSAAALSIGVNDFVWKFDLIYHGSNNNTYIYIYI